MLLKDKGKGRSLLGVHREGLRGGNAEELGVEELQVVAERRRSDVHAAGGGGVRVVVGGRGAQQPGIQLRRKK